MSHRPWLAILTLAILLAPPMLTAPAWAQEPVERTIPEIQGSGAASPFKDQLVKTTGVVTNNFVNTVMDGFFLQAQPGDGDPATSDGVWVFDGNKDVTVTPGMIVEITGRVNEYYGLTEIQLDTSVSKGTTDNPVTSMAIDPPQDPAQAATYLEAREGMMVYLPDARVVGATNEYGDVYVVPTASNVMRLYKPGLDGRLLGLMFPGRWLSVNHGYRFRRVVGALHYTYDQFRLAVAPGQDGEIIESQIFADRLDGAGPNELTLASFNLLNFFDTVDDPGKNDTDSTPSAAAYPVGVARRARAIDEFLGQPDIVAVEEVEHQNVLDDLVNEPRLKDAHYVAKLIEGYDLRGIDVGVLYKSEKLKLVAAYQRQACTPMKVAEPNEACPLADGQSGWMLYSRPPLELHFQVIATGGRLTVIVNHFKSKSGGDDVTTPVRTAMAKNNLELFRAAKAVAPEVPVIILGDLNDFVESEPIVALTSSGELKNLHAKVPPEKDYTFIFNGISQVLDHILVEPSVYDQVTAFGPAHFNTDFGGPAPDDLSSTLWKSSDHDPLVARIPLSAFPAAKPMIFLPLAQQNWMGPDQQPLPTALPATPTASPPLPTATRAPSQPRPTSTPGGPTAMPTALPGPSATPGAVPRTPLKILNVFYDGTEPRTEGDEYVEFQNVTTAEVALSGWKLISVQGNQVYDFPAGFSIAAGRTCRVYTNQDHADSCGMNWKYATGGIWRNTGDKAEIRNAAGAVVDHACFGDYEGQCP